MENVLLEYVWLDGYDTPNLRSKIKVVDDWDEKYPEPPVWNFDGSSTRQAEGSNSECLLFPVRTYAWSRNHYLVLCEVMNSDGTPHTTNTRAVLKSLATKFDNAQFWWGFEQEYFITQDHRPLGFPTGGYPGPQGLYYCGVGGNQVKARTFVESHLVTCLNMKICLTGINAEVAVGQWEFQCFAKDTLKACDDLWISRYVLYRRSEDWGYDIDLAPKLIPGDWNGSGCHCNFSTEQMRTVGGKERFEMLFASMAERHFTHIAGYGENNHERLTGEHETQHIKKFSWGVADRGASIRVPNDTEKNGWLGYVEDRRPASNCDPYVVTKLIVEAYDF